ncbi:stress-induced protein [Nostoc sp. CENA67]|uniref:Stress-induced protein n=1 Tax=Amazonocrinis nigriterrae CENA67 TaxID=2794033 RepID=A0A8J7HWK7_9NOST|nr:KGG domain-containing protein [Amazonocrinis nigriterrae]MBH8567237.1 stress-induced protein [Amazonocrinis nigriterrae CENA67]
MSDTSNRGFASMDEDKQREIASKGGHAAHEKGTAHEFTPEEAREAGKKGGETVSQDREHMAEIGREGGKHSHRGSQKQDDSDDDDTEEKGTQGGTREQHAEAGRQSHKNKNKNK